MDCKQFVLLADALGTLVSLISALVWLLPVWRKANTARLEGNLEWLAGRLAANDRATLSRAKEVANEIYTTLERGEGKSIYYGFLLLLVGFAISFGSKVIAILGTNCS